VLLRPERPLRYLAFCVLLDVPLTAAISWLIGRLTGAEDPTFAGTSWWRILAVMCVFVPLVETTVLAAFVEIARRFTCSLLAVAILSSVIAALAHSLAAPLWGPIIAWTFFLQAICYQVWRERGRADAFGLTCALHALHNLYPTVLLAWDRARAAQP
jgi:hypothetical protein